MISYFIFIVSADDDDYDDDVEWVFIALSLEI